MAIFDKYLINEFLHTEDSGLALPTAIYEEDFATDLGDFTTSGDANWTRVTDEGNGDLFSARSGAIDHQQVSVLQLIKNTTQFSSLLQYDYKTSTEDGFDFLHVKVNGIVVARHSGTNAWTTNRVYVHGIGSQTIQFIYYKDSSATGGTDQVWVDNVGLYSYTESAISNTSTLFNQDVTTYRNFVSKGFASFNGLQTQKAFEGFTTSGDRLWIMSASSNGTALRQFAPTSEFPGAELFTIDTATYLSFKHPTLGTEKIKMGVNATGDLDDGYIQIPSVNSYVRFGEFAGSDLDKMLVVNGKSLFRDSIYLQTVAAEATDVDKFLVVNGEQVMYRTGSGLFADVTGGYIAVDESTSLPTAFYSEDFSVSLGDFVSSESGWARVTDEGNGDLFSARTNTTPHWGVAILTLTKTTTVKQTTLKFDYKTSTEGGFDYLYVMIDGAVIRRYSGTIAWSTEQVVIHGIGSHTVKFVYQKDGSAVGGTDQCWIDNVSLHNGVTRNVNFSADDVTVDNDFVVGGRTLLMNDLGVVGNSFFQSQAHWISPAGNSRVRISASNTTGNIFILGNDEKLGFQFAADNAKSVIRMYNPVTAAEGFKVQLDSTENYLQFPTGEVYFGGFYGNTGYMVNITGNTRSSGRYESTNSTTNSWVLLHATGSNNSGLWHNGAGATDLYLRSSAGTTNVLMAGDAGTSYIMGNLGVGNNSPSYRVDVTGAGRFSAGLITTPSTVAGLPGSPVAGMRAFVTDANATTFASVVAGGGANGVPVYYDGTNWRIG